MDLYTVAGLAGFGAYVAAYALLQFGVLSGDSLIYTGANTLAAALVLISLIADFNLASALIQITWIVIGVVGVLLRSTNGATQSALGRWREQFRSELSVSPAFVAEEGRCESTELVARLG